MSACISSLEKDGGHAIRSTIAKTPCCAETSRLSLLQNQSYCQLKFYKWQLGIFCCFDLDLDPVTFIYELDPYLLEMYLQSRNELSVSPPTQSLKLVLYKSCNNNNNNKGFRKLSYYIRTDRCHQNYYHAILWLVKITNVQRHYLRDMKCIYIALW